MRFIKSEVLNFDERAERARLIDNLDAEDARPMLAILDALERSDLECAAQMLTPDLARIFPSPVGAIMSAYRNHKRYPETFPPLIRQPEPDGFENPNNVAVQHAYAMHVLANTRWLLAKMVEMSQNAGLNSKEQRELIDRSLAALKAATGAQAFDPFKLLEEDGKVRVSFD
jgi:hypothetical protein